MRTAKFEWESVSRACVVALLANTAVRRPITNVILSIGPARRSKRTLVIQELQAEPEASRDGSLQRGRFEHSRRVGFQRRGYDGAKSSGHANSAKRKTKIIRLLQGPKVWLATTEDGHLVFRPYQQLADTP